MPPPTADAVPTRRATWLATGASRPMQSTGRVVSTPIQALLQAEVGADRLRERRQARHQGAQVGRDEHQRGDDGPGRRGARAAMAGPRRRSGRVVTGPSIPERSGQVGLGHELQRLVVVEPGDDEQVHDHRAHLSADHLGRRARRPGRPAPTARRPARAPARAADGRRVLVEHAGEVVGGVGERLDEVDVALRARPPRGRRRPTRAGRAPAGCARTGRAARRARRPPGPAGAWPRSSGDWRTTATPSAAAVRSSASWPSSERAPSRAADASARSRRRRAATTSRSVDDDVPHGAGGLGPRPPHRRRRRDRPDDERDEAADERVEPAGDRRALVGDERHDEHRLHARLDDEQLTRRHHDRDGHREHHDDRHLPRPGAEHGHDEVADEHPDRHPDGHLDDPSQPLAVGQPEAEDRRHRGEERGRRGRAARWPRATRRAPPPRSARGRPSGCAAGPGAAPPRAAGRRGSRGDRPQHEVGRLPRPRARRTRHPPGRPSGPSAGRRSRRRATGRAPCARSVGRVDPHPHGGEGHGRRHERAAALEHEVRGRHPPGPCAPGATASSPTAGRPPARRGRAARARAWSRRATPASSPSQPG